MQTSIAGIPHRKPDLSILKVGDHVNIAAEPENKFDPNALKVMFKDVHLGYVPKTENCKWNAHDITLAKIVEIEPMRKWTEVIIESL